MFREEMAQSHGMLFLFDPPRPVAFWMRNTPLPLDLIFLDASGRVLNVIADAVPFSEEHLSLPNQPKVRHSHGLTRGKLAELKAVIAMIASGPNR